jgi:hypothetical protein
MDRPDQKALQPDEEGVREALLPGWKVREDQPDRQEHADGGQEELEMLGQTCP